MRLLHFCILVAALFCVGAAGAWSQTDPGREDANSEGTEFWICFQKNYRDFDRETRKRSDSLSLELFITSNQNANVRIEIDGIGYRWDFTVRAGTVSNIRIDTSAQVTSVNQRERLAIHIISDNPIAVYGLNRRFQTTDTYLALPVSVLGTEYRVIAYEKLSDDLLSQTAVIATEDDTRITVTPTTALQGNHPAGVPFTVDLRRGDVYQMIAEYLPSSKSDLTGTLITSNKKIAVFSGHNCAYVPSSTPACNHLVEQLPPLASWGKHFYVGTLEGRSRSTLRVLANEPNTKVFLNSELVTVLNSGEYYENPNMSKNTQITADKPVLVAQYAQGFRNGDSIGDPMMILVSPTQQFLNRYRFATPVNGAWRHYISVVVPRDAISSMKLNGQGINPAQFRPFAASRYMIANLEVPYGTHTIQGAKPFGLYSYGFGFKADAYDAYGNMGGQSFAELTDMRDTLAPMGEGQMAGELFRLIFRDDRETDRGMKKIGVLSNEGLDFSVPLIVEGVPQTEFAVRPVLPDIFSKALIEAIDAAGNRSVFTICYTLNSETGNFNFTLTPGEDVNCAPGALTYWGVFAEYNYSFHSADFSSAGNIRSLGTFDKASGSGGIGGLMWGIRLSPEFGLSARLGMETIGGVLTAPDSVQSRVLLPSGELRPFQESRTLDLQNIYLSLSATGEYYFSSNYYALLGLKGIFALSKSVVVNRAILIPENYSYTNGEREKVVLDGAADNLSTFVPAVTLGMGTTFPVWKQISLFGELFYTQHFGDLISDGDWSVSQLGLHIGARVRL